MRLKFLALIGLTSGLCCAQVVRRGTQPGVGAYPSISVGWNSSSSTGSSPSTGESITSPYTSKSNRYSTSTVEFTLQHPSRSGKVASNSLTSTAREQSAYGSNGTLPGSSPSHTLTGTVPRRSSSYGFSKTAPRYSSSHGLNKTSSRYSSSYGLTGTGSGPHRPGHTSNSTKAVCSGETLNVLNASLDWWYTRTMYNIVSVISVQYNKNDSRTGWTVLPATTSFDLSSALASPTCVSSLTFNKYWNISVWDSSCAAAATPVAASTTVVSQTAYSDISASTGTGPIPYAVSTPPPASMNVPGAGGIYSEGTAFVYFSAYEIMSKSRIQYDNGSDGCAETTQVYHMAEPFSFEYTDGDVNGSQAVGLGVKGDVNPAFLKVVEQANAVAGSWVAEPTVAVVVQDVYAAEAVLAAAQGPRLTTQTVLQTPSPTLPPGFSIPPSGQHSWNGRPTSKFTGRVESTEASLQVPSHTTQGGWPGGHQTQSEHQTQGGHQTHGGHQSQGGHQTHGGRQSQGGHQTHAGHQSQGGHQTHGGHQTQGDHSSGRGEPSESRGPVGHIISAIISAAKPTNAVQVLEQATATFTHTDATAGAILSGLSGPGSSIHDNQGPGSGSSASSAAITSQMNGVGIEHNGQTTVVVVGGTTFTANAATQFQFGSSATLTAGGTVVVEGTTVSLAPGLTAVVVNGHTHGTFAAMATSAPVLTIDGTTFTANSDSTYNIEGQSLTQGGVITVHGSTISLAPGASKVVINGVTEGVSSALVTSAPVLTIGGTTYQPNSGATYTIGGETLTPGGVITIHGTTISLGPSASSIVVNGATQNLITSNHASITAPPVLTIGGETFTAINHGYTYVINGETLTPNEVETVTVDGQTYVVSLSPSATVLVVEMIGSGDQITATTYETLRPSVGSGSTVTETIGVSASAGSRSSAGPSHSVQASLQNGGQSLHFHISGICVSLITLALAIWL